MSTETMNSALETVEIVRDGKTYSGRFEVSHGIMTVLHGKRRKVTQVGGMPPKVLAQQLLAELVPQAGVKQ